MTAPTPPRQGRPEWLTREALMAMSRYSHRDKHIAREILACWDQIAELRRELEQARAQAEWRPIETAPRDGTSILLASDEWGWILVADNRGGPRKLFATRMEALRNPRPEAPAATQVHVARSARIMGNTYARLERGEMVPSAYTLWRIAGALGVGVDDLLPVVAQMGQESQ